MPSLSLVSVLSGRHVRRHEDRSLLLSVLLIMVAAVFRVGRHWLAER